MVRSRSVDIEKRMKLVLLFAFRVLVLLFAILLTYRGSPVNAQSALPTMPSGVNEVQSIDLDGNKQPRRPISPHSILSGIITSAGAYRIEINGGDRISLHRGTVIRPIGTKLTKGLEVRIFGRRDVEGIFRANLIEVFNGKTLL